MKKKILCIALALCMIVCMMPSMAMAATSVAINETNFPDSNFRTFVADFDTNDDGYLGSGEISSVIRIDCSGKKISNLQGIEFFTSLQELDCGKNTITTLDVSKNTRLYKLYCYANNMSSLNLGTVSTIQDLQCNNNKLTELNVSNLKNLTKLYCDVNCLTELDVSQNTKLTDFICSNNNLTSIDLSKNTALNYFYGTNNKYTVTVEENGTVDLSNFPGNFNVSKTSAWSGGSLNGNVLTFDENSVKVTYSYNSGNTTYPVTFTLIKNTSSEESIEINEETFPDETFRNFVKKNIDVDGDSKLSSDEIKSATKIKLDDTLYDCTAIQKLDGIEYFTNLEELIIYDCKVESLDLSQNLKLTNLACGVKKLASINLRNNTALTSLSCYNTQLTSLDLSQNTALTEITCTGNKSLENLILGRKNSLETLTCYYNALVSLDLSGCTALTKLECGNNQLTSLDVSNCTKLTELTCYENKLTSLDLSKNTNLTYLSASSNKYAIGFDEDRTIDLSLLAGFDVSKASAWYGGTVSGNILTVANGKSSVTYSYDCGRDKSVTFTLNVHQHTYGNYKKNGDGTHTGTCTTSGCGITKTENCSGGTAYCTKKATCATCGQQYGDVNPSKHSGYQTWTSTKEKHTQYWTCCNAVSVAESDHEWKNGKCTSCYYNCTHTGGAATCTQLAVCETCGLAYGEKNANSHTGTIEWVKTDLTHAKEYSCCGLITEEAESHQWNDGVCSECGYVCEHTGGTATCTEQAVCSVCNQSYGETNPTNHSGTEIWVTAVTTHKKVYNCCGAVTSEEANHTWGNGQCSVCGYECTHNWVDATCTTPKTCSICGATEGAALDHDYVNATLKNKVEATCTATGYSGDLYCSRCNTMILSGVTTEALGHDLTNTEMRNVKAATCTEKGYTGDMYCLRCNSIIVEGEETNALGHDYENTEIRNATTATCTQLAYTGDIYCTRCNTIIEKGEYTGTYAHDYANPVIKNAKAATCKEKGYTGDYYCRLCDGLIIKGAEIDTLAHDYDDPVIKNKKEPTCTEAGYYGDYYCKNCDTLILDGSSYTLPALGHIESIDYSYDGMSHWKTCTREGCTAKFEEAEHSGGTATVSKKAVCEICGQEYGDCLPGKIVISGATAPAKAGKEVTVDIMLDENTGLTSLAMKIVYNKEELKLLSVENGKIFSKDSFTGLDENFDGSGDAILQWYNGSLTENITATGKLATLKFEVNSELDKGDVKISFDCNSSGYGAVDFKLDDVAVTASDATITVTDTIYGDVNGDGAVRLDDILYMRRAHAGWTYYNITNTAEADLDLDSAITLKDITILERHIAGWSGYEKIPMKKA